MIVLGNAMVRRFLIFLVFWISIFSSAPSFADNIQYSTVGLYSKCILGYQQGDLNSSGVQVFTIGSVCNQICQNSCSQFSRLSGVSYGYELNSVAISNCNVACRQGQLYNPGSISVASGSGAVTQITTTPIAAACPTDPSNPDSAAYNIYPTTLTVKQGDQVSFNLAGGSIYMCGNNTVTINPVFSSEFAADWLSSYNGWKSPTTSIATWNARNYKPTDTGIDVKDGDYLQIYYVTDLVSNPSAGGRDPDLLIRNPNFSSWYDGSNPFTAWSTLPGDQLQFPSRALSTQSGVPSCTTTSSSDLAAIQSNNIKVSWNGLTASTNVEYASNCDTVGKNAINFAGFLSGWSTTFSRLGIAHHDAGVAGDWNDNLGGATVTITRYGCPYSDGTLLQFAVAPTGSLPQATDWVTISPAQLQNLEEINMPAAGTVYLRIQPLAFDNSLLPTCNNSNDSVCQSSRNNVPQLYQLANTNGSYTVVATKAQGLNTLVAPVTDVISTIRTYLYGNGTTQGIIQNLFMKFIADSNILNMIRALLVLYIAYTGLSYALGIAQISQKDGIKRMVAIGIVVTLLSPDSWTFFNTYLFRLFVDGGIVLMTEMVNYQQFNISQAAQQQIAASPEDVFEVFDAPLLYIFSTVSMLKVSALIFSSLVGWIVALAVIFAGIMYAITLFQAMLIYAVSLIIMGFLLILAPIFISFVLFDYTRSLFIAWLQQLLTVALQPVFIITAIGMFATLMLYGLEIILGFTICNACLLQLYLPLIDIDVCLASVYMTLFSLHLPTGYGGALNGPLLSITAVFYLLILAQAMYVFVPFMVSITNQLVGFGFYSGIDMSVYRGSRVFTRPFSMVSEGISFATGRADDVKRRTKVFESYTTKPISEKWKSLKADYEKGRRK